MKVVHTLLVIFFVALLAGCSTPNAETSAPQVTSSAASQEQMIIARDSKLLDRNTGGNMPDVGEIAPDFEYTLGDGSQQKLSDLRGKKVILNFWATWCEPCREEMPDLDKARVDFGKDVVIIGVNKAEKLTQIDRFTDQMTVGFMLVANPSGDISQRYGTRTIPNSFFINSDGTIGARELKIMDYDTIKQHVEALH